MLREPDTLFCQPVDVRRLGNWMTVAAQVAVPHVIGKYHHDVWLFGGNRRRPGLDQCQAALDKQQMADHRRESHCGEIASCSKSVLLTQPASTFSPRTNFS